MKTWEGLRPPGTCGDQFQIIIGASEEREWAASRNGLQSSAEASQSVGHARLQL